MLWLFHERFISWGDRGPPFLLRRGYGGQVGGGVGAASRRALPDPDETGNSVGFERIKFVVVAGRDRCIQ